IFVLSLLLLAFALTGLLFGVNLEAVAPATGTVIARDLQEIRSLLTGLVEPGWYEGQTNPSGAAPRAVRCDGQGEGIADPADGKIQTVHVTPEELRFHRLQPGDLLWPGQVVAVVRSERDAPRQQVVVLRVPSSAELWMAVQVRVAPFQAVQAG